MNDRAKELLHRMNVTKGARFNAAKRLEGRDRQMALVVALASALVIALTVIPFIYRLPPAVLGDLSVVTLVASILILAVSLVQYSNNDAVNAEQHHRCGLEIMELSQELSAKRKNTKDATLENFGVRYSRILHKYSVNHDGVDYDKFRIEHPHLYSLSIAERAGIYFRSTIKNRWPNFLMAAISVFFLYIIFLHVLPARLAAT